MTTNRISGKSHESNFITYHTNLTNSMIINYQKKKSMLKKKAKTLEIFFQNLRENKDLDNQNNCQIIPLLTILIRKKYFVKSFLKTQLDIQHKIT